MLDLGAVLLKSIHDGSEFESVLVDHLFDYLNSTMEASWVGIGFLSNSKWRCGEEPRLHLSPSFAKSHQSASAEDIRPKTSTDSLDHFITRTSCELFDGEVQLYQAFLRDLPGAPSLDLPQILILCKDRSHETELVSALNLVRETVFINSFRQAELQQAELFRRVTTFVDPQKVAQEVVDSIYEQYGATEVALLEKRGNFLSVIASHGDLSDVPRLYIKEDQGIVCDVADSGKTHYAEDVRELKNYLPIVETTLTQFTVSLVWRNDPVGVLVVGLGRVDALSGEDRDLIEITATQCASSIVALRNRMEQRAIIHKFKDVLPLSIGSIKLVLESKTPESLELLEMTAEALQQCTEFVEEFSSVDQSVEQFDIVSAIKDRLAEEDLSQLALSGGLKIDFDSTEELQVVASPRGFNLALGHVVRNGLESMKRVDAGQGRNVLSVSVERVERFTPSIKRESSYISVNVTDQGEGLPIENQDDLTEVFVSKGGGRRLGTGLSITKRALDGFGGRLNFYSSESGAGAVFNLLIPCA